MKVSKLTRQVLVFLLIVSTPALCVQAEVDTDTHPVYQDTVLDVILERGVLKVGTTADFLPFSYYSEALPTELQGVDIELAKDLGEALGVDVQFVETTWPTLMDDLLAGKFDIAMSGITIKLDRQKQALFSVPVLASGKAAITRDENVDRFRTIEDINQPGVRVIANPGGTNESFARANFPKATIVLNEDNLTVFKKIVSGDVDLMVTDAVETLVQEKIHPELDAVNPEAPFNFFEFGYMLNRDHIFKAFVDQWISLKLKDGSFQTVFDNEIQKISAAYLK